ncbi:hypothetical protein K8R20_00480 [bacterium]|nr:hypothetical protein [bacterium]
MGLITTLQPEQEAENTELAVIQNLDNGEVLTKPQLLCYFRGIMIYAEGEADTEFTQRIAQAGVDYYPPTLKGVENIVWGGGIWAPSVCRVLEMRIGDLREGIEFLEPCDIERRERHLESLCKTLYRINNMLERNNGKPTQII